MRSDVLQDGVRRNRTFMARFACPLAETAAALGREEREQ